MDPSATLTRVDPSRQGKWRVRQREAYPYYLARAQQGAANTRLPTSLEVESGIGEFIHIFGSAHSYEGSSLDCALLSRSLHYTDAPSISLRVWKIRCLWLWRRCLFGFRSWRLISHILLALGGLSILLAIF